MKDTKNNDRSRWMMAAGFMAALYIFWRYAYPCALAYHEQMQLFLWNGDYLMDRLAEPGGVARYLAEIGSFPLRKGSARIPRNSAAHNRMRFYL